MIADSDIVRRKADLITAQIDDESVVLNSVTGMFFQLNASAARIWELIETAQSLAALCAVLVEQYDVTLDACRNDVVALLESMRERGLIEIG